MSKYQPIDSESKDEVTDVAVDILKAKATDFVQNSQLTKIKTWVGEGPMTFRVLCLCGGIAMVILGFMGFIGQFLSLSPLHAIIEVYSAFFGGIIMMLEGRGFMYPQHIQDLIRREAKFLTFLSGRGAFYIFVGTLLLSQWPNLSDSILGFYMTVMGVLMFIIGSHANSKLAKMKNHLTDETIVRAEFQKFDADRSGSLDIKELAELCKALGSDLDKNELEVALAALDKDGNGQIEYSEFLRWWQSTTPVM